MEGEQGDVGVRAGGDVGYGGSPADPGIKLAEIDLVGVGIHQHVDLEEASIALGTEPVTQPDDKITRLASQLLGQDLWVHLIATPAAAVGGELGMPGQLRHERTDDGAVAGEYRLDRDRAVVDSLHHLDLVADQVALVSLPAGLIVDEERGLAGVAVRRLDDQVRPEAGS